MDMKPKYSVIVPVYNRVDEVRDLLESLYAQQHKDFEVILVEDGSTEPCGDVAREYADKGLDVKYFYKSNDGRSIARNYGIERAAGDYFIFFDSDCVIPPDYFVNLDLELRVQPLDCFGGPDAAHDSFSDTQKAINFAMTSFLTTGGIRGGKVQMEKFVPRSFNMGYSRKVWQTVGGFREMFSEDIDMSMRIREGGFSIGLIRPACVYHKRRIDMKKILASGICIRHVAYHTETALSSFVEAGTYTSGVSGDYRGVACGVGHFCIAVVHASHRIVSGGFVCERMYQHAVAEGGLVGYTGIRGADLWLWMWIHKCLCHQDIAWQRKRYKSGNSHA